MSEYAYKVGELVQVNPAAFDEQLPGFALIQERCLTGLFRIEERRVHRWADAEEGHREHNLYRVPGAAFQDSDGWIAEGWLKKWDGSGKISMSLTFDDDSLKEEYIERIYEVLESHGIPRDSVTITEG